MAVVKVWQLKGSRLNGTAVRVPKQPVAHITTQSGYRFSMPFAPRSTELGGWSDEVTSVARPGLSPATFRTGDGLPTLSFDVTLARRDIEASVEDYLTRLRKVAASGEVLTIGGLSKFEQGPWFMSGCSPKFEQRQPGTNKVTRATVSLSFTAAVNPVTKVGPVSGGRKKPKPQPKTKPKTPKPTTRYYRIKKGECLWILADRYYGDPTRWPVLARASKIKNVRRIPIGYRIVIPPKTWR